MRGMMEMIFAFFGAVLGLSAAIAMCGLWLATSWSIPEVVCTGTAAGVLVSAGYAMYIFYRVAYNK